jgi:O-antigen/teichoic acid export membrane protein
MNSLGKISLYTIAGFLGAGINFIVMPILSHYINPTEYGILSLFNTYVTILIPLIGILAAGLIRVEYYRLENKEEFASLFSSIQLVPIIPFLFFATLTLCFHKEIASITELTDLSLPWLISIPILSFLIVYVDTFLNYLVIKNAPVEYLIFNVSKVVLEVLLTLLFVVYFEGNWKGRILSWLITTCIYCLITIIYFKKENYFTTNIQWKYIKEGIVFGTPLILHTIGKFVINQSDRLFIAKYISLEEAGIYNMGYQIGMVLLVVVNAFGNFFTPYAFARLQNITNQGRLEIVRMSYGAIAVFLLVLIILTLVTPLLFATFIDERYSQGTIYVFWTGLSYVFWGANIIFSAYIYYLKKTTILAYLSIVNIILNIALNFVLINVYGAIGAAYATCISFFVVAVLIIYYANKFYPMPWLKFNLILKRFDN